MSNFHELFVEVRAACRRSTDAVVLRAIGRAHMGSPSSAITVGLLVGPLRQYRNQVSASPHHLIEAAFRTEENTG